MSDRLLAIFLIGHHPADGDYLAWLRQRMQFARVDLDDLKIVNDRGEGVGTWAGMPCQIRHLDAIDSGPLVLSFNQSDFDAAMALPPATDYQLPPPLAAFAHACRALHPNVAVLTSQPVDEADIDRHAADLDAKTAAGPSPAVFEYPYSALFLDSFHFVMLEDDLPLMATLPRQEVAGGVVFLGVSGPEVASADVSGPEVVSAEWSAYEAGGEIRNPDFRIWFPTVEWSPRPESDATGHEVRCSFDVVRANAPLLNQGTEELCRRFLAALGIEADEVYDWTVERICTPFFTNLPDSPDWRDRYRISWRMTIHARTTTPFCDPGTEPIGVVATDATDGGQIDRAPGTERCEVLAVEVTRPGEDPDVPLRQRLRDRFPELAVSVSELTEARRVIRIGRLRIGPMPVEPALDHLDTIVSACAEMGLVTNIPRYELQRARVG